MVRKEGREWIAAFAPLFQTLTEDMVDGDKCRRYIGGGRGTFHISPYRFQYRFFNGQRRGGNRRSSRALLFSGGSIGPGPNQTAHISRFKGITRPNCYLRFDPLNSLYIHNEAQ